MNAFRTLLSSGMSPGATWSSDTLRLKQISRLSKSEAAESYRRMMKDLVACGNRWENPSECGEDERSCLENWITSYAK